MGLECWLWRVVRSHSVFESSVCLAHKTLEPASHSLCLLRSIAFVIILTILFGRFKTITVGAPGHVRLSRLAFLVRWTG
eukprot:scaffold110348_cov67-Attheya_sp.AAC.1